MIVKNEVQTKASQELCDEVIKAGLCTMCGACVSLCPYFRINPRDREIRRMDICERNEGRCYLYCPRTTTDMDALYRHIFGVPYDAQKVAVGVIKDVFLGRTTDEEIRKKAQDGGVVTTLLNVALQEGIVDGVVETMKDPNTTPYGFIARNKEELLYGAGSRYESSFVLEALNRLPIDSKEKLSVVGLPCQVAALAKMKMHPHTSGINGDKIKLVIGLFCGWSLSPDDFYKYLKDNFDLSKIVKFDIPHHPAHSFDVYIDSGKIEIDLNDIQKYINSSCSYCADMTSQFADVSVGSGRAKYQGWSTVIVRTEIGAKVVDLAKKKGLLETQPIPEENLINLKRASRNKIRKALDKLHRLSGSEDNSGYLKVDPTALDAALKE